MTFSPYQGGPVTIDHENIVKAYSLSPLMLGRGHILLDPDGPSWVRSFAYLLLHCSLPFRPEFECVCLPSSTGCWLLGWKLFDYQHVTVYQKRKRSSMSDQLIRSVSCI
jgi:hypothetical protein